MSKSYPIQRHPGHWQLTGRKKMKIRRTPSGLRQVFRAQTSSALFLITTLWNGACGTARGTPAAGLIRGISVFIVFALIMVHKSGNLSAGYQVDYLQQDELLEDKMDALISMDLKGVSLIEVLKILSLQSGLNFIASEAVAERKITLYLDNITVKDAMDEIFSANNLTYEFKPGKNIFIVKDWGSPALETDTRVYPLKYVRSEE